MTVLGTPVGSPSICQSLVSWMLLTPLLTNLVHFKINWMTCKPKSLSFNGAFSPLSFISWLQMCFFVPCLLTHPIDPYAWTSPFVQSLNNTVTSFLAHVSGCPVSAVCQGTPAWFLAHLPIQSGGLGFTDYSAHAVTSFVVPLAHSIHCATQGICPICSTYHPPTGCLLCYEPLGLVPLPLPLLATLHALAPPLLASQNYRNVDDVVDHLIGHLDL